MDTYLLLTFGTTHLRTRTLRINNVRQNLTDLPVRQSMNGMIASQAVSSPATGSLLTSRRAQLITRSVKQVDLSA